MSGNQCLAPFITTLSAELDEEKKEMGEEKRVSDGGRGSVGRPGRRAQRTVGRNRSPASWREPSRDRIHLRLLPDCALHHILGSIAFPLAPLQPP